MRVNGKCHPCRHGCRPRDVGPRRVAALAVPSSAMAAIATRMCLYVIGFISDWYYVSEYLYCVNISLVCVSAPSVCVSAYPWHA